MAFDATAHSYKGKDFRQSMLNSTNYYRKHHDAKDVTWNFTLAKYAYRYASKCVFEHSGGPYGENLALGYDSPAAAVDAWGNEGALYKYKDPGFSDSTGHFTQLVWVDTTEIGCAAINCDNTKASDGAQGWYVVCEYNPPGNVIGYFPENVKKGSSGKKKKHHSRDVDAAPVLESRALRLAEDGAVHVLADDVALVSGAEVLRVGGAWQMLVVLLFLASILLA